MDLVATRRLDEAQTEAFDVEYVNDDLWRILEPHLRRPLSRPSRFLDVGGGNGRLVDRILDAFPLCEGVNLEPARNLVLANEPHPRKQVIGKALHELDPAETGRFDVITINWVLHHLVVGDHLGTRIYQAQALRGLAGLLNPGGALLAFENIYDGLVVDEGPSRIIHALTASRRLKPLVARLGANTAGVGVCFHSEMGWRRLFASAGLELRSFDPCYEFGALSPLKRLALHLKSSRVGLFAAVLPA